MCTTCTSVCLHHVNTPVLEDLYMCSISSFLSVLLLGLLHIIQIYIYLDKMTSSSCLSCLYACTTYCHCSLHIHCKWMCGCGNTFVAYCIYNVYGYDNFTTPVIARMGVSPPSLAAFVSHLNCHYYPRRACAASVQ